MTAEKRNLFDTTEALYDKLHHIRTIGRLLVDGCEQPALGAGDMVIELAEEAQALTKQVLENQKD